MRTYLLIGVALNLCVTTVHAASQRVLVIGIDGLRPDALAVADTPNLDALIANSAYSDQAQGEALTFSGPNWSSIINGVHYDLHDVTSNSYGGHDFSNYPNFLKRLEDFDSSLNTARFTTWDQLINNFSNPNGVDFSFHQEYNQQIGGVYGDEGATLAAVDYLTNNDPDAIFFYFADVDVAGHNYGFHPSVPGYLAEIESTDAQVGQMMTALNNRPGVVSGDEEWLIIVTSDHGGAIDGSHSGNTPEKRTVPFIVSGSAAAVGAIYPAPKNVDVTKTVLSYMGAPIPGDIDGHVVGLSPSAPPPIVAGQNLVFNGDAEYDRGFDGFEPDQAVTGWDDGAGPGNMTIVIYDAAGGFPTSTGPGPAGRGDNFFSGGANETDGEMTQSIDLRSKLGFLRGGDIEFEISAYLGGYASQNDRAEFSAIFLDDQGEEISRVTLGPVTASQRGNVTGLFLRDDDGFVPAATAFIEFELHTVRTFGGNDGYADNLVFRLTNVPGTDAPLADLNLDGQINGSDWQQYIAGLGVDMDGLSIGEAYGLGDLTGDFVNNYDDFVLFQQAYEGANGAGSFQAMLASVPEPASFCLGAVAGFALLLNRSASPRQPRDSPPFSIRTPGGPQHGV